MKRLYLLTLTAAACLISSCQSYYYAPTMQHVPLFREAGELRAQAAFSSAGAFGTEGQASYSLTNELAVMAGYTYFNGGANQMGTSFSRGSMAELAAGYYKPLGQNYSVEVFGGMGLGSGRNRYLNGGDTRLHMAKAFVQPNMGFRNAALELALSTRLSVLNYYTLDIQGYFDSTDESQLAYLSDHRTSLMAEPAATLRLGWKAIKLQAQLGFAFNLTAPDLPINRGNANVGIVLGIQTRKKQSAQP
jgi:hypothetical protein